MKLRSFLTSIGSIALGLFIVFGGVHVASALTVAPPLSELDLTPGQTTQTQIKLYNETRNPVTLYSEVVNFGASGETGNPSYDFSGEKIGLSSWIDVAPGPITINAGDSAEIPIKINTPENAEPGGHYAVVFFSENPPSAESNQVAIGTKVGTLYLADVAGDVTEDATIAEFGTTASRYSRLPVNFFVRYNNIGNIHLRPTGKITIKNMFGKTAGTVQVNATRAATLPGQIRRYEASWEKNAVDNTPADAFSGFWQEYTNDWHNFAFGKYTATIVMTAQTSTQAIQKTSTTQFWVIPWRLLLVDGLVIIIIILLLVYGIRKYNDWIIHKAGGHTTTGGRSAKVK